MTDKQQDVLLRMEQAVVKMKAFAVEVKNENFVLLEAEIFRAINNIENAMLLERVILQRNLPDRWLDDGPRNSKHDPEIT